MINEEIYSDSSKSLEISSAKKRLWTIPKTTGLSPVARWGHTSVLIQNANINENHPTILIFGGFDGTNMLSDLYLFDIVTNCWKQPTKVFGSSIPSGRAGHTMTIISKQNNKLLMLGGGNGVFYLSDLWLLEILTEEDEDWKKEMIKLKEGTSTLALQTTNNPSEQTINNSFPCMNVFRWTQPKLSSRVKVYISDDDIILSEEQFHKLQEELNNDGTLTTIVESMINSNSNVLLDLNNMDSLIGFGNPSRLAQIDSMTFTMKEIFPAPRSRHTVVPTPCGTKIIMFGGGGKNRIFDDIWILDVNEMEWSQPSDSLGKPSARWGHSASIQGNIMYIFGGLYKSNMLNELYTMNLDTFVWTKIDIEYGAIPAPRAAHTSDLIQGRYMFILWGGDDLNYLNDLFIFDIKEQKGKRLVFKSPKPRCAHSTIVVEDRFIFVFGGGDGHQRFKEVYLLDTKVALEKAEFISPTIQNELSDSDEETEELSYSSLDFSNLTSYIEKLSQTYLTVRCDITIEDTSPQKDQSVVSDVSVSSTSDSAVNNASSIKNTSTESVTTTSSRNRRKRSGSKKKPVGIDNQNSIKEVANWLVNIGLGKYATLFLQEEIDLECLPLLTESDLFKIGITKFGPRKKILEAAKKLQIPSQFKNNVNVSSNQMTNSSDQMFQYLSQSVTNLSMTCERISDSLKTLSTSVNNLSLMFSNPSLNPTLNYLRHPAAVAISNYYGPQQNGSSFPPTSQTNGSGSHLQSPHSPRYTNPNIPPPPTNYQPIYGNNPYLSTPTMVNYIPPPPTNYQNPIIHHNSTSNLSNSPIISINKINNSNNNNSNGSINNNNNSLNGNNTNNNNYNNNNNNNISGDKIPIPPPPNSFPSPIKKKTTRKRKTNNNNGKKSSTSSSNNNSKSNDMDTSPTLELPSFAKPGESWYDITEKDEQEGMESE
ncbi:hypothetical protein ABK040_011486 [Willaertia magna]